MRRAWPSLGTTVSASRLAFAFCNFPKLFSSSSLSVFSHRARLSGAGSIALGDLLDCQCGPESATYRRAENSHCEVSLFAFHFLANSQSSDLSFVFRAATKPCEGP